MTKRLLVLAAALLAAFLPTASAFAGVDVNPQIGGNVKDDTLDILGIKLPL